jgi:predicted PurR-regulated permease PerM
VLERLMPAWRNVALALLAALLLWFAWTIRSVLNPLILGYLLAYVVHPLVLKLERRGWGRRTAVNVIFLGAGLSLLLVGVVVFLQGRSLVTRLSDPELHEQMWSQLERELEQHRAQVKWIVSLLPHEAVPAGQGAEAEGTPVEVTAVQELRKALAGIWRAVGSEEHIDQARQAGLAAAGGMWALLRGIFGSMLAVGTLLVLLPIYTYFLLFELDRIHGFIRHYLPAGERTRLSRIGAQIGEVLASFFRGRLLVSLLKGLIYALGLWIAGIDYALLIGLGAGLLSLIPFVGSALGFVMATLIGFLEHSLVGSILRAGIVFGIGEVLENYLLIPKILGNSLSLHPVVVVFAVMAGGAAFGMFGLLVALPVTASLVILAREFLLPTLEQIAQGRGAAPPEAG